MLMEETMNILIDSIADNYMDEWINSLLDRLNIERCAVVFSDKELLNNGKVANNYATSKYFFWEVLFAQSERFYQDPPIEPVDTILLKKMEPYVDEIFWMMERCENREYNHRWRMYCKHLRLWNHILESMHINCFVCCAVPHEVYSFIIIYTK